MKDPELSSSGESAVRTGLARDISTSSNMVAAGERDNVVKFNDNGADVTTTAETMGVSNNDVVTFVEVDTMDDFATVLDIDTAVDVLTGNERGVTAERVPATDDVTGTEDLRLGTDGFNKDEAVTNELPVADNGCATERGMVATAAYDIVGRADITHVAGTDDVPGTAVVGKVDEIHADPAEEDRAAGVVQSPSATNSGIAMARSVRGEGAKETAHPRPEPDGPGSNREAKETGATDTTDTCGGTPPECDVAGLPFPPRGMISPPPSKLRGALSDDHGIIHSDPT